MLQSESARKPVFFFKSNFAFHLILSHGITLFWVVSGKGEGIQTPFFYGGAGWGRSNVAIHNSQVIMYCINNVNYSNSTTLVNNNVL